MQTPVLACNLVLTCTLALLTLALSWQGLAVVGFGGIVGIVARVAWLAFIVLALTIFQLPTTLLAESVLICSSVFLIRLELRRVFHDGESKPLLLVLSGLLNAILVVLGWFAGNIWFSVTFLLALLLYGCLHSFLHEREAHLCRRQEARNNASDEELAVNQPYEPLSPQEVFKRWLPRWGLAWLGTFLLTLGSWCAFMTLYPLLWEQASGIITSFLPPHPPMDALEFGYFSDFHRHFASILLTLFQVESLLSVWDKVSLILQIPLLFLISGLPILGIFRSISSLPGRLRYRVLRFAEEERLLYLIVSVVMILSTFSGQGTTSHLLAYGVIAIMLGYIALIEWIAQHSKTVAAIVLNRTKLLSD